MISSLFEKTSIFNTPVQQSPIAETESSGGQNILMPKKNDSVDISDAAIEQYLESIKKDGQSAITGEDQLASEENSVWKQMSEKYDVRNMTQKQMEEMSLSLYDSGQISLFDHAIMSLDRSRIMNSDISESPETTDFIQNFENQLSLQKKYGNSKSTENLERILGYLNKVEQLAES